ncbi:MAG: glycosyltransferase [Phycisphaerales bacterium]|nr:glycosyltransferase [Phycisphaerales bacterium]
MFMRVLMLGWEFPPFITGGLGTACYGLTRALDDQGVEVLFVLPGRTDPEAVSHLRLVSPDMQTSKPENTPVSDPPVVEEIVENSPRPEPAEDVLLPDQHQEGEWRAFQNTRFVRIPTPLTNPYQRSAEDQVVGLQGMEYLQEPGTVIPGKRIPGIPVEPEATVQKRIVDGNLELSDLELEESDPPPASSGEGDYGGNLMDQVEAYARFATKAAEKESFDVIHAHDWMTFPAGLMLARRTGRPLVVHVHSTEFDRSGENVNQQVYDIERRGMQGAIKVITVSRLTKNIVTNRYGVAPNKVSVVYNGINLDPVASGMMPIGRREKIVLYMGRITFQKGPEYFIRSAARVLQVMKNVRFVIAGSGDMYKRCIELAAELGIGHKILFTGFLRGKDIDRVFSMANLYVMPSVSEPFGIAPLEALSHDVPALISKSSGVSEVLTHALKVDFWDTEAMADKIVAVLKHPPLSQTLRRHAAIEVRQLTWQGAAANCRRVYEEAIESLGMPIPAS